MPVTFQSAGAFTASDQAAINRGFTQINADFFVDGDYGFDGNPGTSAGLAFRTFGPLSLALTNYRRNNNTQKQIVIAFCGVTNYEWSTPKVNDVYLIGSAGYPRQATTSGVPNGGGATWLSPTSGTGALLTVNGQGWTVDGIFFNNSATANPCILLTNDGDPPVSACGESFLLQNCTLTGSDDGLKSTGLPNHVTIRNNVFRGFSGAGDIAISYAVGAGTGTLYNWKVLGNSFQANANHITMGSSGAEIAGNHFSYIDAGVTSTTQIVLTGGANNSVHDNACTASRG